MQDVFTLDERTLIAVDKATGESLRFTIEELFPPFTDQIVHVHQYPTFVDVKTEILQDAIVVDQWDGILGSWDEHGETFQDLNLQDQIVHDQISADQLQDVFTFSDQLQAVAEGIRPLQDSSTFADQLQTQFGEHGRLLQDSSAFSDTMQQQIQRASGQVEESPTEVFGFADNLVRQHIRAEAEVLQETFTFSDSLARFQIVERGRVGDILGLLPDLIDNLVTTGPGVTRQLQDSFIFSDQILRHINEECTAQVEGSGSFLEGLLRDTYRTRLLQDVFNFAERGINEIGGGEDLPTVILQDLFFEDVLFADVLDSEVCLFTTWDKELAAEKTYSTCQGEAAKDWTKTTAPGKTWNKTAENAKTWSQVTKGPDPWTKMTKDQDCAGGIDFTPTGPERKP
jgi:hypothetical protein